jgi:capsular polysaccharide transport system ATP-binding protein
MNVRLENVTKFVTVHGRSIMLFDQLDLEIERTSRIGILALPKSGKTTLLRMICGTERPDSGRIRRDMTISWPIPNGDFMVPASSIAWNMRSLARIYGVRDRVFVERVRQLSGLTKYMNLPFSQCPPPMRGQLTFAAGIGVDFDLYLFDNQAVPQRKEFKDKGLEYLRQRTEGKAILVATSGPPQVAGICDSIYVLERGRVTHFPEAKAGIEYFKALQKAEAERQKERQEQQDSDDDVPDTTSGEGDQSAEMLGAALSDF